MNMPRIPHVSTRGIVTALGVSALVVGAAIVNPGGTVSQTSGSAELVAELEAIRDDLVTIDAATADALSRVDALIAANTTTTHPATTTTAPTSTTRPTQTTTTRPGPTTTAAPTTTTISPPVVLPPTIPIPLRFDGFTINLQAQDVNCVNQNLPGCENAITLWDAKYQEQVPYTADVAGWLGGEREAYACAYMFLQHDGELVGRVTFAAVKPPRTAVGFYGTVKDTEMVEGVRFFDGSPTPLGTIHTEPGECPGTTVPYTTVVGPDVRPRIGYLHNGEVIEIRDYGPTAVAPGTIFNVVEVITEPFTVTVPSGTSTVNGRVTVLGLLNGTPQIAVYYDSIGTGNLVFEP